jgi:uncharacterized membrane protein
MNEFRTKIELPRSDRERSLDLLVFGLLGVYLLVASVLFQQLPERVPTHFGVGGTPDAFGSRMSVWVLPAIAVVMVLVFRVLSNYPHHFNLPVKITPENAEIEYRKAIRLMQMMSISLILVFLILTIQTSRVALGHASGLGMAILAVLLLPALPLMIYLSKR